MLGASKESLESYKEDRRLGGRLQNPGKSTDKIHVGLKLM